MASGRPSTANSAGPGSRVPLAPPSSSRSALWPHTQLHWACLPGQLLDWSHPAFSSFESRQRSGRVANRNVRPKDTERSCLSQAQPVLGRGTSRAGLRQLEPRAPRVQSPLLLNTCQRNRCRSGLPVPFHFHRTISSLPGHILGMSSRQEGVLEAGNKQRKWNLSNAFRRIFFQL